MNLFDLTKEIKLDSANNKKYRRAQFFLYAGAVLSFLYLCYLVLFPGQTFTFSFINPNSNQNSILYPLLSNGQNAQNGKLDFGNILSFDTSLSGNFSRAKISLIFSGQSAAPQSPALTLKKSYQAFFYHSGDPIGFKNGSLLKNNGNYYIVSDGNLKKFADIQVLKNFGYTNDNFMEVPSEELKYNPLGSDIAEKDIYPNGAIFKINNDYYILENQELKKFTSGPAYLSGYGVNQAIAKDASFLQNFPVSKDLAGFADGTLISNGISAYIVSAGLIYPINNVATFENKGFQWDKIIPAGEDDVALYEKAKLFQISNPHPDGTIFLTQENSQYYMIINKEKHLLPGIDIAGSWLGQNAPISVSEKSLTEKLDCQLSKNTFGTTYSCSVPITSLSSLLGANYEFIFSAQNAVRLDSLKVSYSKDVNFANIKESIKSILSRIISTYAPTSSPIPIQ